MNEHLDKTIASVVKEIREWQDVLMKLQRLRDRICDKPKVTRKKPIPRQEKTEP